VAKKPFAPAKKISFPLAGVPTRQFLRAPSSLRALVAKKPFAPAKKISSRLIKPRRFFNAFIFLKTSNQTFLVFFNFLFFSSCTFAPLRLSGKKLLFLSSPWRVSPPDSSRTQMPMRTSLRGA
jgi:hypothetical protein